MNSRFRILIGAGFLSLSLLTAICYYPGLNGPFVLDDSVNLRLSQVQSLDWDQWVFAINGNYSGRLGRPVAATSFAFTSYFAGLDPWSYKLHNLLLHLTCGFLLLLLTKQVLRSLPSPPSERKIWIVAGLAATLWLLHPLNVSTTLYAVQRMAQLSTLFVLLALCFYSVFRPRLDERPYLFGAIMAAGIGTAAILGVFSKENAALLPVYLLILETVVYRWKTRSTASKSVLAAFQGLFVLIPLFVATVYVAGHFQELTRSYAARDFTLWERLLTESKALWFYLKLIYIPDLDSMSLYHDQFPVQRRLDLLSFAAIAGHAALLMTAIHQIKHNPVYSLGISFFYAAHLLESTFLPLELVFEHRNYLASWGPLLLLSYYGSSAANYATSRLATVCSVALLLCLSGAFAYQTHMRATIWSDHDRLQRHAINNDPVSVRALSSYAARQFNRGHISEGRAGLRRAIKLAGPKEIGAAVQLLTSYCGYKEIPDEQYANVWHRMRHGLGNAKAHNTFYALIKKQSAGQCPALQTKDLVELARALLVNPSNAYGKTRYHALMNYARTLSVAGRHEETIRVLRVADAMRPKVPNVSKSLALHGITLQYIKMGNIRSARTALMDFARLTRDPRIPAKAAMHSFLSEINKLPVSRRYGVLDFSEYARGNIQQDKTRALGRELS